MYDDYMGYDASDSITLYPSRTTQQISQLENKYDYDYGLDRQWNTNYSDYDLSHTRSTGKQLPKLPSSTMSTLTQNLSNVADNIDMNATSNFLPSAIPIASGNAKKSRQLPQPIATSTLSLSRKRLPRTGPPRQLPQMPLSSSSATKPKSRISLMSRSDTEYSKFGVNDEFERRGAVSAMLYEDYNYSSTSKQFDEYQTKSTNDDSVNFTYGNEFYSNDSLNTTAQSLFSEYSTSDRRNKTIIPITTTITTATTANTLTNIQQSTIPLSIASSSNLEQQLIQTTTDPYRNYSSNLDDTFNYYQTSDTITKYNDKIDINAAQNRKRLPQIPITSTPSSQIYETLSDDFNFEPITQRTTAKRLPIITPKINSTLTNC